MATRHREVEVSVSRRQLQRIKILTSQLPGRLDTAQRPTLLLPRRD